MAWNLKGLLHDRAIYRSRTLTKLRVVEITRQSCSASEKDFLRNDLFHVHLLHKFKAIVFL